MEKSETLCDCLVIHDDAVQEVKELFFPEAFFLDLSDFYKVFSDSTRLKILYALDKHELCVCDLSVLLNTSISAVSHQLKVLRDADLVKNRREGKVIYYSLKDEHVEKILECGIEHIQELKIN